MNRSPHVRQNGAVDKILGMYNPRSLATQKEFSLEEDKVNQTIKDLVTVNTPSGEKNFEILEVQYI